MKPSEMTSPAIYSLDKTPFRLKHSSSISGPEVTGGLHFGTTYMYASVDKSGWLRVENTRSYTEAKRFIESHHDLDIIEHLLGVKDLVEDISKI